MKCRWESNINVWFRFYVFPKMKVRCLVVSKTELLCSVSQFPHSCISEWFIYSQDRSAYFVGAKWADRSWEYINHSQEHECRNWERCWVVSFLGIHKSDFRYSVSRNAIWFAAGRWEERRSRPELYPLGSLCCSPRGHCSGTNMTLL